MFFCFAIFAYPSGEPFDQATHEARIAIHLAVLLLICLRVAIVGVIDIVKLSSSEAEKFWGLGIQSSVFVHSFFVQFTRIVYSFVPLRCVAFRSLNRSLSLTICSDKRKDRYIYVCVYVCVYVCICVCATAINICNGVIYTNMSSAVKL